MVRSMPRLFIRPNQHMAVLMIKGLTWWILRNHSCNRSGLTHMRDLTIAQTLHSLPIG